jgi:hypothetical protein
MTGFKACMERSQIRMFKHLLLATDTVRNQPRVCFETDSSRIVCTSLDGAITQTQENTHDDTELNERENVW